MSDSSARVIEKGDYQTWAGEVARLCDALEELRPATARLDVERPEGQEWYELLERKLRPQVSDEPVAIVAFVGGTNIGKSALFNHLAGEEASAVSPMAAGTRHPVCLVPTEFDAERRLPALMPDFVVTPWSSSEQPLEDASEHRLFWRHSTAPERLLILDTPDIDSDVEVNWQRADRIRHAADVLVAVLTQQKYNDAAVKRYFRSAVEADKEIIVIFNQCDLADDAQIWPQWLATFKEETGADPELVYVVPYDRQATRQRRLPFYQVGPDGTFPIAEQASLRDDLATLHFSRIKIRALRGALSSVLDQRRGLPAYLRDVSRAAETFAAAAEALAHGGQFEVRWPTLPASVLVQEIRDWWHSRRSGWSRTVHGFYGNLGRGLIWPVKATWESLFPDQRDPLEKFRQEEWNTILSAIEHRMHELEQLAELGNEKLRPRLKELLSGQSRESFIREIQAEYAKMPPVDDDYRRFIREELDRWSHQNPGFARMLRSLDQVAAVARPAITVTLTATGFGLVHDAITNVAAEALATVGIAGGGEAIISGGTEGVRHAAARLFNQLQQQFILRRAAWFNDAFERSFTHELLHELRENAEVARSEAFRQAEEAMHQLMQLTKA